MRPRIYLEHYWQRWFERLPPGVIADSKRARIMKALDRAVHQFSGGEPVDPRRGSE